MKQSIAYLETIRLPHNGQLVSTLSKAEGLIHSEEDLSDQGIDVDKVYTIENENGVFRLTIYSDGYGTLINVRSGPEEQKSCLVSRIYKLNKDITQLKNKLRNLIFERDFYKEEAMKKQPK